MAEAHDNDSQAEVESMISAIREAGEDPVLVMGADARAKVVNLSRSLEEERVRIIQLVAEKP